METVTIESQKAAGTDPVFWTPPPGALPAGATLAMTTRLGGVSRGPYAELNVGLRVGDREDSVLENIRRVRGALGMDAREPARVRQVHGIDLEVAANALDRAPRADGFLLEAGDPWAAVSVADCAAVALVAEDGARGALVHSGWRGTLDGIAVRAALALERSGSPPETLRVVIGPCIHVCCYPVGPETAGRFPAFLIEPHVSGGFALDLPGAIAASLSGAGVPRARIAIAPECTACLPDRFYSHRRDRGTTGRHWMLLRLAPLAR
ncbi:MAG TPA: polyphenol oxidase family protein [Candidatus Eisenbacteria bacterium]|nr:polyphenol oxidase family protein [Candidatus Eisenbacteria bacterium]